MPSFHFEMSAVAPFRLDFTVWALRRRPDNIIDRWNGETYRRVLVIQGIPMEIAVTQPDKSDTTLYIFVNGANKTERLKLTLISIIEKMLGTQINCTNFYTIARRDEKLKFLSNRFMGLKPPRFPTVFEALVNAIACQQLSLDFGITLLNRLTNAIGRELALTKGKANAFPSPYELRLIADEDLRAMSFSRQKAGYLLNLANTIVDGEKKIENISELSNKEMSETLQELIGVGRWTAEYVMLRGLGKLDIFPGDDAGAQNSLQKLLNLPTKPSYSEVKKVTNPWYPYAGFVYFHLLLSGLAAKGHVTDIKEATESDEA